jgi:uncharacterized protein YukE
VSRVIADPAALRQFAQQLTRYVTLLRQESDTLDRQFAALGAAWRDDEHRRFAGEYVTMARQVWHFCDQAEQHAPLLERKAARLDAYFGGGASAGVAGGTSAGAADGAPGSPLRRVEDPHRAKRLAIRSHAEQHLLVSENIRQNGQRVIAANTTWIEVDKLPVPDITSDDEFKKISVEHCTEHLRQLEETVEPWINTGSVREDFAALDAQLGRDSTDQTRYVRTFELFFGGDPIIIDGSRIISGRHRIYLARKLGIPRLPVRVLGNKP